LVSVGLHQDFACGAQQQDVVLVLPQSMQAALQNDLNLQEQHFIPAFGILSGFHIFSPALSPLKGGHISKHKSL